MAPTADTSRRAANEAAIRRYCEAWRQGDLAAIVDCYHDDLVLHYFGRSPLAGAHRGKAAALAVLAKVQQLTNRQLVEIHDVLVSDQHAAVMARERFERDGRQMRDQSRAGLPPPRRQARRGMDLRRRPARRRRVLVMTRAQR